jgi:protein N-terminal methyltransferase
MAQGGSQEGDGRSSPNGAFLQTANDARISTAEQLQYWAQQSVDDNGMLGGYAHISRSDIQFSRNFLSKLRQLHPVSVDEKSSPSSSSPGSTSQNATKYAFRYCLESGAGIGRVTLNLLASMCKKIDVVEPIEKFTAKLTAPDSPLVVSGQLRRVYNVPLQHWTAESIPSYEAAERESPTATDELAIEHEGRYDLIWNQWCLSHLSSPDLVRYLRSLIPLLASDGWIIVKENISTAADDEDIFWEEDSSVTRSDRNFRACVDQAGLMVVRTQLQTGFPKKLLPVRMYALRPASWGH